MGSSQANMLLFPEVHGRVKAHNPEAWVPALLRAPVEGAYSGYWFARLRGWDLTSSFEEALDREENGELQSSLERFTCTYLEKGHYAEQLERWLQELGREQILALFTAELAETPELVLTQVLSCLGVSPKLAGVELGSTTTSRGTPGFMGWRASCVA